LIVARQLGNLAPLYLPAGRAAGAAWFIRGGLNAEPGIETKAETAARLHRHQHTFGFLKSVRDAMIESINNMGKVDVYFDYCSRLFRDKTEFNLHIGHKNEQLIVDLAYTRWVRNYPPRKDNDRTMGDAINWEWILHCSKISKRNVIIVTRDSDRDSDYGSINTKERQTVINQFLMEEFKERAGSELKIRITQNLSEALEALNAGFTEEELQEATEFLKTRITPPTQDFPIKFSDAIIRFDEEHGSTIRFYNGPELATMIRDLIGTPLDLTAGRDTPATQPVSAPPKTDEK
jgi:hypothetical protein